MFEIDGNSGELVALGQSSTGKALRLFNLITGGDKFLVAAGQGDGTLTVYSRDVVTGLLKQLNRIEGGSGPSWVMGLKLP